MCVRLCLHTVCLRLSLSSYAGGRAFIGADWLLLLLMLLHARIHQSPLAATAGVRASTNHSCSRRFLPLPAAAATQYLQLHVYFCAAMAYVTYVTCAFY